MKLTVPEDYRRLLDRLARAEAVVEAARDICTALAYTVTTVEEGERPHWCRYIGGKHDPTCSGMLHAQDIYRAALAAHDTEAEAGSDER